MKENFERATTLSPNHAWGHWNNVSIVIAIIVQLKITTDTTEAAQGTQWCQAMIAFDIYQSVSFYVWTFMTVHRNNVTTVS